MGSENQIFVYADEGLWPQLAEIFHKEGQVHAMGQLRIRAAVVHATVEQIAQIRQLFTSRGFVGWLPLSDCKKPGSGVKAAFFDMDSTVIAQESIVLIAENLGLGAEVASITEEAMAGRIDFTEALRKRVALLKGLKDTNFLAVAEQMTLQPGIEELLEWLHGQGVSTYLVSGGFRGLSDVIAERLGFAGQHANRLEIKSGSLSGCCSGVIVDGKEKMRWARRKAEELGVSSSEVLAVGDGANDSWLLGWAGLSFGYEPKKALYPLVQTVCGTGNHVWIKLALKSWQEESSRLRS